MPLKSKLFPVGNSANSLRKTTKRKINPEFITAIRAAKMIRECAARMRPDRGRFHRLAKFVLHQVIHRDSSHQRGERQILPEHLQVFEGYEFERDILVSDYLKGDMILRIMDRVSVTIPAPVFIPLSDSSYCKIMLLGVGVSVDTFTNTCVHTDITPWIALNDQALMPVSLEIPNDRSLLIAIGIAYANNTDMPVICQAVRIITVTR